MKHIPLNKQYKRKLIGLHEALGRGSMTHAEFKEWLGVEWSIWTAKDICSQFGIIFDWSEKRWRQNRSPYQPTLIRLWKRTV